MPIRRFVVAATCSLALAATGCTDVSALQFRQDKRLEFQTPGDRETVTTPLRLTWTMSDFTVLPRAASAPVDDDHGYFAVFVDRSPIKPDHLISEVTGEDATCRGSECLTPSLLAQHGVYLTHRDQIVVPDIPRLDQKADTQLHQITVVLLDANGRRIGEAAWYREFKIKHKAIS